MKDQDSDRRWLRSFGLLGLIISDLLITTGVGLGIGYLLWSKWGAPWWVLLISAVAGLILAFYRLYQYSKKDFN